MSMLLVALGLYIWFGDAFSRFVSSDGPGYYAMPRFIFLGGGAICLMAAASLTRNLVLPRPLLVLSTLGDSSYALYLLHPFILLGFKSVLKTIPPDPLLLPFVLTMMVVGAIGLAHAFHLVLERRINAKLRTLITERQRPAAMEHV
jgi:exopolysaccharide production protein ExoZ